MLHKLIALALLLPGAFAAQGQLPAKTSPEELRRILEVSRRRAQLEIDGGQPFHMNASFEYLGSDGKMEKGTLDELWEDAHHFRQEITLPDRRLVEIDNETQRWRTGEWVVMSGAGKAIESAVMPFYPLPNGDRLSVEGQQRGTKDLDCVGTEPTLPGVSPDLPLAETTFCLARGNHFLRLIAEPNHKTITFDDIQEFQGKYIARTVEIYSGTALWARLHVDSLTPASDFSALDEPAPETAQSIWFHRKDLPFYGGPMHGQQLDGGVAWFPHLGHQGVAYIKVHVDTTGSVTSTQVVKATSPWVADTGVSSLKLAHFRVGYDRDHLIEFDDMEEFRIDK